MRGTHCFSSMAVLVTQTCPNGMLCVCCLSWLQAERLDYKSKPRFSFHVLLNIKIILAAYYSSSQNRDYAVLHCLCSYKKCQSDEI